MAFEGYDVSDLYSRAGENIAGFSERGGAALGQGLNQGLTAIGSNFRDVMEYRAKARREDELARGYADLMRDLFGKRPEQATPEEAAIVKQELPAHSPSDPLQDSRAAMDPYSPGAPLTRDYRFNRDAWTSEGQDQALLSDEAYWAANDPGSGYYAKEANKVRANQIDDDSTRAASLRGPSIDKSDAAIGKRDAAFAKRMADERDSYTSGLATDAEQRAALDEVNATETRKQERLSELMVSDPERAAAFEAERAANPRSIPTTMPSSRAAMDKRQSHEDTASRIATAATELGIDPKLAVAIAKQESSLRHDVAVGAAGDTGLFQLTPPAIADIKRVTGETIDPTDIEQNIRGGLLYLKILRDTYGLSGDDQIAAFNGGPNSSGKKNPEYVKNVKARF
jgi:soluble lytic murein transglycosylase-like protein